MAKPRYFSYQHPEGELGSAEIPGVVEFFPRSLEFGITATKKSPTGMTGISKLSGEKMITKADRVTTYGQVCLPMPQNLIAVQSANYSVDAIGSANVAAASIVNASNREAQISGMIDLLKGGGEAAMKALGVEKPMQLARGQIINPFSFTLFQGMAHRTFSYNFQLLARSPQESYVIKKICDTFMYYQLPARDTESVFNFIDIPLQWDIKYKWFGNKNQFLESPNRSVLTSVNVQYGNGGSGAMRHTDGSPIDVGLDLTYTEIEPLFRESFGDATPNNPTFKSVKNPKAGAKKHFPDNYVGP